MATWPTETRGERTEEEASTVEADQRRKQRGASHITDRSPDLRRSADKGKGKDGFRRPHQAAGRRRKGDVARIEQDTIQQDNLGGAMESPTVRAACKEEQDPQAEAGR